MYRRRDRSGKPTGPWYISVGGRRISSGTTDRERAKRKEDRDNTALWDAREGLVIPTWGKACMRWLDNNPALAHREHILHWIEWWSERIGAHKRLEIITPALVHEIIVTDKDRAGVSLTERTQQNSTANNYVSFVRRVIHETSTLRPHFQIYPQPAGEKRWAPVPEWLSIAKHLTQDERDVITWALASGLREANCMFWEWAWDRETWGLVPITKNGDPLGIPYNRTMQEIMTRRRAAAVKHVRYVFTDGGKPWYTGKLLRALERACAAAEVEYITFHGLRHTYGTWMARAGVPREIRMRLMAHRSGEAHDIYIHYDVEGLRPYAEIVDRLLAGEALQIPHTQVGARFGSAA